MNKNELKMLQSLPLEIKEAKSLLRIEEYVRYLGEDKVYVSFSGGKDSTVLLHLVQRLYPNVQIVFSNTGLEFPELVDFVKFDTMLVNPNVDNWNEISKKTQTNVETLQKINKVNNIEDISIEQNMRKIKYPRKNLTIVRPEKSFKQVIEEFGYPMISKKTARMISDCQNPTPNNIKSRTLYLSDFVLDKNGNPTNKKNNNFKIAAKWRHVIDSPYKISHKCCDYLKKKPIKKFAKETGLRPIVGTMASESKMREDSYLATGCNSFRQNNESCSPIGFWTEQDVLKYIKKYKLNYASVYGDIIEDERGVFKTTGEKRTGCIFCGFGVHLEKGENRYQRLQKTHPQLHNYCMNKLGFGEVCNYLNIKYEN